MKIILLLFTSLFVQLTLLAQQSNNNTESISPYTGAPEMPKEARNTSVLNQKSETSYFDADCNTDFWTVDGAGDIQQWSLINGVVSGGSVILSNAGTGLAYCGDPNSPTFYSANSNPGTSYYDTINGWTFISAPVEFSNQGGHGYDQFYHGLYGGSNKLIYHFDGTTFTLVDNVDPMYLTTYDIAVDATGKAWVFKGDGFASTTQLDVYDINGVVASYPMIFDSGASYGAFFLNDTLYLAFAGNAVYVDELVPVIINGGTAAFGTPIPFVSNGYYDMASCNSVSGTNALADLNSTIISVYPNPTNGSLHFDFGSTGTTGKISLFDNLGRMVYTSSILNSSSVYTVDMKQQESGMYYYTIETEHEVISGKVNVLK